MYCHKARLAHEDVFYSTRLRPNPKNLLHGNLSRARVYTFHTAHKDAGIIWSNKQLDVWTTDEPVSWLTCPSHLSLTLSELEELILYTKRQGRRLGCPRLWKPMVPGISDLSHALDIPGILQACFRNDSFCGFGLKINKIHSVCILREQMYFPTHQSSGLFVPTDLLESAFDAREKTFGLTLKIICLEGSHSESHSSNVIINLTHQWD